MIRLTAIAAMTLLACDNSVAPASDGTTTTNGTSNPDSATVSAEAPAFYRNFTNGVKVTVEGDFVVLTSNGLPDHKSPYYSQASGKHEAYNGSNPNFRINPNGIVEQQLVMRIPITQTKLATPSPTPLGPIGMALNGVAIFNQYAAGMQPLGPEADSFDQYNGHPQQMGQYHYHLEPVWLTRASKEALVGVLLDGFPVYGPMENGRNIAASDLDAAHGHTTATKEFPQGIYHYHTTSDAPYINGSGFAGKPGTVSR